MSRQPQILVTWLLLLLALSTCQVQSPQSRSMLAEVVAQTPAAKSVNPWSAILKTIAAPRGWRVAPCDGDAPFLCAESNREVLGTVELQRWSLEQLPDFRKQLTEAGLTPGTIDLHSAQQQAKLQTALRQWVEQYYSFFRENRRREYGNQIRFVTQPPQPVAIGQLTGLKYGFIGQRRSGGVHEQQVGYVAFDGKTLYVIATGYDPQAETTTFKRLQDLQTFLPFLTQTLTALQLP